jgi:predicted nucleotidyltransferase
VSNRARDRLAQAERDLEQASSSQGEERHELLRLGYFGSYAHGDWGVGSDLDLVAVVCHDDRPFETLAVAWDLSPLPDRDSIFGGLLRTVQSPGPCSRPRWVRSWSSQKCAASTTGTSGEQPEAAGWESTRPRGARSAPRPVGHSALSPPFTSYLVTPDGPWPPCGAPTRRTPTSGFFVSRMDRSDKSR